MTFFSYKNHNVKVIWIMNVDAFVILKKGKLTLWSMGLGTKDKQTRKHTHDLDNRVKKELAILRKAVPDQELVIQKRKKQRQKKEKAV